MMISDSGLLFWATLYVGKVESLWFRSLNSRSLSLMVSLSLSLYLHVQSASLLPSYVFAMSPSVLSGPISNNQSVCWTPRFEFVQLTFQRRTDHLSPAFRRRSPLATSCLMADRDTGQRSLSPHCAVSQNHRHSYTGHPVIARAAPPPRRLEATARGGGRCRDRWPVKRNVLFANTCRPWVVMPPSRLLTYTPFEKMAPSGHEYGNARAYRMAPLSRIIIKSY